MLPCPDDPPSPPEGGWMWYNISKTTYKCPEGFEFSDGSYPLRYSECNLKKKWDPPEQLVCKGNLIL